MSDIIWKPGFLDGDFEGEKHPVMTTEVGDGYEATVGAGREPGFAGMVFGPDGHLREAGGLEAIEDAMGWAERALPGGEAR